MWQEPGTGFMCAKGELAEQANNKPNNLEPKNRVS